MQKVFHVDISKHENKWWSLVLFSTVNSFLNNHISYGNALHEKYCDVLGYLTLYVTCLRYLSHLNTKCDVLEYWRHCSVCYSGLFSTSQVVTTVSFTMWSDPLTSRLGVVLVPLLWSFDVLWSACWSAFYDLLSVFSLLFCPFICCPWIRMLAPQREDTL
jgi:hypothetical protein